MLEERVQGLEREVTGLRERLARVEREQGVEGEVRQAPRPAPVKRPEQVYAWREPTPRPEPKPVPVAPRPVAPKPVAQQPPAPRPQPPAPKARPTVDIEDLLGGRVLAWLGGAAVAIGLAFLMALAISSGWIDEGARTVIAGVAATALIGAGIWLHEHKGRTDAALASLSAGIASMFGVAAVATSVYHLVPDVAGLGLAVATGALATALAVRWESQGIAALGLLGAMVAPAVGGDLSQVTAMAVLFVAASSAVAVLLSQGWRWLSFGVVLVALPQWIGFLTSGAGTLDSLAVLVGFGVVGVMAAIGHELRARPEALPADSAFLLMVNALCLGGAGWYALETAAGHTAAVTWIWALGAAHVALALWSSRREELPHDLPLLLFGAGTVIADIAFALTFDGPVRTVGWVLTGVAFAGLAGRHRKAGHDTTLVSLGLGGHLTLALAQAVASDATPELIGNAATPSIAAGGALVALAAGCFASGRLAVEQGWMRTTLDAAGLAVLGYLTVISLDGLPLVLALAGEAVALAGLARRQEDEVAAWGALGTLALGLWFAFVLVPPAALTAGLGDPLAALAGMGALAAAFVLVGRLVDVEHAQLGRATDVMAVALVAYLTVAELDGVLLVGALVAEGLLLAAWCRWKGDSGAGNLSVAMLGLGLAFAVVIAPPSAFATGLDDPLRALCALGAVALGLLVAGRLIDPERSDLGLLIDAAAVTVVGYLTYLELDGTALVGAVAAEATLLALWARGRRDEFAAWAAISMVTIGAATAVLLVPPTALWAGLPDPLGAGGALLAVMVAAGAIAWLAPPEDTRPWLVGAIGLVGALPGLGPGGHPVPARRRGGRRRGVRAAGPPAGPGAAQRPLGAGRPVRAGRGAHPRPAAAAAGGAGPAPGGGGQGVHVRPGLAGLDLPGGLVRGPRRAAAGGRVRVAADPAPGGARHA